MSEIEVLFLGTGTSAGVPMIGCSCEVCVSPDPRDRRNRPSIVVRYDDLHILVDATPELRVQSLAWNVKRIDTVVFTHAHADHMMGVDDLRRFNAIRNAPIDVWADPVVHAALNRCFGYAFREPTEPVPVFRPHLVKRVIDGAFRIGSRTWRPIPLEHGDSQVLGFRIDQFAYCTDVSHIPDQSFELLAGVDTLILDALQFKKHPAHLTIDEAIAASTRIGARTVYFTHMTHHLKHADTNKLLPPGMELAYDGLVLRVPAP
jgi:phosphoribosyl 1,2-cyclic phosphate phosphodiesterase